MMTYLSLFSFSVGVPSTILLMYSVQRARRNGCLPLIPWWMSGMEDEENGRSDKMHLWADSASTLMVTTSRRNKAARNPVERDSKVSPSLIAVVVIRSHTSLQ